jgi:hypothetical protein
MHLYVFQQVTVRRHSTVSAQVSAPNVDARVVTAQGKQATVNTAVQLTPDNKFVQMSQEAVITDEKDNSQVVNGFTIIVTSQGPTRPVPSDFNRPSICNSNNQGENDNSQSNAAVGPVCMGTIPNICF